MRDLCHKLARIAVVGMICVSVVSVAQPRHAMRMPGAIQDPEQDSVNVDVAANSVSALVMRLKIQGDDATPTNLMIATVPVSMADFSRDPSRIIVEARDPNGVLVGRTSVADRKMSARDGEPVLAINRTVSVVVPILSKPDSVTITIPGLVTQPPTPVGQVIDDHCIDFPADEICSGAPPDASPFFNLLRLPEP